MLSIMEKSFWIC